MRLRFRMWDWWVYAVVAALFIFWVAPAQLQVTAYKVSLVTLAVVLGYLADRALFARAADRIAYDQPRDIYSSARLVARALIVFAVVLGVTHGI